VPHSPKSKLEGGLPVETSQLKPGLRLAVALSGGADSVALLRALAARCSELGLVLHVAHLHHGLRGDEADGDLAFCRNLAAKLGAPFHEARVDAAALAEPDANSGKERETIEEAGRRLRYAWFRELMRSGEFDAVATAHTLDDQAETVLAKFLRGAWTEGLAGIAPVLKFPEGPILRPLLAARRVDVESYLRTIGQDWREDTSNRRLTFTRNRIRHELLPLLEGWNPRVRQHLAQMADLARDEETWWRAELARVAPQILLPGKPVRGGGRAAGSGPAAGKALEIRRLSSLAPALQRRLLRHAAEQFGARLDFSRTEALRLMALSGHAGQKLAFPDGLRAERTARELRLDIGPMGAEEMDAIDAVPGYSATIPGEIDAPGFGLHLHIEVSDSKDAVNAEHGSNRTGCTATLRNWRPGDRIKLRHSGAPRKVKEVLEHLRVTGTERALWPVLEVGGRIVWMQGVETERELGLVITAASTRDDGLHPQKKRRVSNEGNFESSTT
jgi:tRNA(Ile)-lysidine synthase